MLKKYFFYSLCFVTQNNANYEKFKLIYFTNYYD